MNMKTDKPTVFISYSHLDDEFRKQFHSHLGVLEKTGRITVWDDRQIDGGEEWYPEIIKAMEKAAIAVCLISPDFLKSDFINKEEVPFFLQKRRDQGMLILPVLVRPCLWNIVEWIEETQMLPRNGKSISADFKGNEDTAWNEIATRIFDVIDQKGYALPPPPPPEWPELPEEFISIERLPQTGKDVFGRKKEITLLDQAWEDETRIIAFIASGGVGKSALINKWADRMKKDNFRGASRVFAWSFYSQGTSKTISSSDQFIFEALCWFGERQIAESNLSPWEKGAKLAEIIGSQKTLLFLDGIEPLQSEWKYERGLIKDPTLSVLIKELAKKNKGLCVITSRENLPCLKPYKKWALQENLDQISPEAGRTILRVAGIRGTDEELEQVTRDFGNHALAIALLSSYLQFIPGRKASEAYSIPDLDIPIEEGRHPKRLLNAFTLRFGEGAELNALSLLGLFDRPVTEGEIQCIKERAIDSGIDGSYLRNAKGRMGSGYSESPPIAPYFP
jgi:hypothetical protein